MNKSLDHVGSMLAIETWFPNVPHTLVVPHTLAMSHRLAVPDRPDTHQPALSALQRQVGELRLHHGAAQICADPVAANTQGAERHTAITW